MTHQELSLILMTIALLIAVAYAVFKYIESIADYEIIEDLSNVIASIYASFPDDSKEKEIVDGIITAAGYGIEKK